MSRPVLAALAILAGFVAGCGDDSVDIPAIEGTIKSELKAGGTSPSSVKCPDEVTYERGKAFKCDVTMTNGATGEVQVTLNTKDDFLFKLVPGSVQVPGATVEKEIEDQLASQGIPDTTVNCPDNIIVKLNTSVTCDVAGAKGAGKVTFSWSDDSGTVDESSVQTSS
jgi:hypothetical protein